MVNAAFAVLSVVSIPKRSVFLSGFMMVVADKVLLVLVVLLFSFEELEDYNSAFSNEVIITR